MFESPPDSDLNPENVGKNIFWFRVGVRGATAVELGRAVGITSNAVRQFELGMVLPRLSTAVRMARALGVGVELLWKPGRVTGVGPHEDFDRAWAQARTSGRKDWRYALERRMLKERRSA